MREIRSKADYAALLALFYSYFGGLEAAIGTHFQPFYLPDYAMRRKTSSMVNDLAYLDTALPLLAQGEDLPEITNHFQALGALYVIEGSTLGGSIIGKMLKQQLNITVIEGLSYFNSYGDNTAAMWQIFKQSLNQPGYSLHNDVIIGAANQAFIKFSNWFDVYNL